MTDDDKLAKLQSREDHAWDELGHGNDERYLDTIERCQRIRASLEGPLIKFPEIDNPRIAL